MNAARSPRQGWEESFRAMAAAGDDAPLWPDDLANEWDETEWEWEEKARRSRPAHWKSREAKPASWRGAAPGASASPRRRRLSERS